MAALDPDEIHDPQMLRDRYAERTRTMCNDCGASAKPPETTVAAYPLPWRQHLEGRIRCAECWAAEAAAQTDLSEKQARVLALVAIGFGDEEIGDAIGCDPETIQEQRLSIDRLRADATDVTQQILETL
ncbi:MAG: hypothetical protein ABEH64_00700 [Salinirussus sp.]